jgi:hypothetical protein
MPERHDSDGPPNPPAANPSDLAELIAAAVRGGAVDADAERRVLAAFRAARDEGAHRAAARNRRRDDWRPVRQRRGGRPVRATLVALVASLTLGGVAVAAIGSGGGGARDEDAERGGPLPASSTPTPTGPPVAAPNPSARDIEAHCRAYDSGKKHGKALDPTAWQRLGNGRGRHPPQERPRPSRGTGRAAARTFYSAGGAFSVTPHARTSSCSLYGHGRGTVSGRNVPFAPECGRDQQIRGTTCWGTTRS